VPPTPLLASDIKVAVQMHFCGPELMGSLAFLCVFYFAPSVIALSAVSCSGGRCSSSSLFFSFVELASQ